MSATVICQNCFGDNLNIDGLLYTCLDCDYEWEDFTIGSNMEDSPEVAHYNKLIQLNKPYFSLKRGKIYKCTVDNGEKFKRRYDEITIIPLATEENRNRLYILSDAKYLLNINKQFVQEIIDKDFDYLYYGYVKDNYPEEFGLFTTECATDKDGVLIDDCGAMYYGLVETEELD